MAWLNTGICFVLFVLPTAVRPANHNRESVNTLRVFSPFPHGVAVFTSSNDTVFKCMSATRTHFNPEAGTVTYVWHLKAHSGHPKRDIVVDLSFGVAPGQAAYFVNQGDYFLDSANYQTLRLVFHTERYGRSYTAFYEYSDYETCAITNYPLEGHDLCTLWVKKAVKHNVPKHCLEKYEETCDSRFPLIDRDLCKDEDD